MVRLAERVGEDGATDDFDGNEGETLAGPGEVGVIILPAAGCLLAERCTFLGLRAASPPVAAVWWTAVGG